MISDSFKKTDREILIFISVKIKNRFFDAIMPAITHSNDYGIIYVVLIMAAFIFGYRIDLVIKSIAVLALGVLLGEFILKKTVKRFRPFYKNFGYRILKKNPKTSSFPSGHTTSAFAVLTVLWGSGFQFTYLFLILAVLIAFSRMYLGFHYPSDIVAGIILGLLCGGFVLCLYNHFYISSLLKQVTAWYFNSGMAI